MIRLPHYQTKRLLLKNISLEHLTSYEENFVDYEVIRHLSNIVPWPYPEGGIEDYIKNIILKEQGKSKWVWGIFLQEKPNEIIGAVELLKEGKPEHRGFWLGKKYWGRGIMTEAVYPIIDYAFENFSLEKLIFANAVGNTRSRRIKEKTGSTFLKTTPCSFVDSNLTEQELWELTKKNWKSHQIKHPQEYYVLDYSS